MIKLKETVTLGSKGNTGFINFLQDGDKEVAVLVRNMRGRVVIHFVTTDEKGEDIIISTKTNEHLFDDMINRYERFTYLETNQIFNGWGYQPLWKSVYTDYTQGATSPMGYPYQQPVQQNNMKKFHNEYKIETNHYYNEEKNWGLIEVRTWSEITGEMIDVQLHVIDMHTCKIVKEEIDDVWVYEWKKM